MSRVCSIHEEFCPDDVCRWCESPPAEPERLGLMQAIPDSIWYAGNQNQQATQQNAAAWPLGALYVHYAVCHALAGTGVCNCAAIAASHT